VAEALNLASERDGRNRDFGTAVAFLNAVNDRERPISPRDMLRPWNRTALR
jgi:hypothetical protein